MSILESDKNSNAQEDSIQEDNVLDTVLKTSAHAYNEHTHHDVIHGTKVGVIKKIVSSHLAEVQFNRNQCKESILARTTVKLSEDDQSESCTLVFQDSDPQKPIITGIIKTERNVNKPLVIESDKGIEIQCGHSKIEITDKEVSINGQRVTTRAYGLNRVQGASIKLN